MDWIGLLWLPTLVSGVAVFFASFLAWMVIGHHKSDWKAVGDEEAARGALRGNAPGQYVVPYTGDDWKSPEATKKFEEGPVAYVTVVPSGAPKMGGKMLASILLNVGISVFCAYIAATVLDRGAAFLPVFRIVGTVAVAIYGLGHLSQSIWFGKPKPAILKDVLDGVAYGLITAAIFGALWPG